MWEGTTPPNCPSSLCKCKDPKAAVKVAGQAPSAPAPAGAPAPVGAPAPAPVSASEATPTPDATPQPTQESQEGKPKNRWTGIQGPREDEEQIEGVGMVRGWTAEDSQQQTSQQENCRIGLDGLCHEGSTPDRKAGADAPKQELQQAVAAPQADHEQGFEVGDPSQLLQMQGMLYFGGR